MTVVLVSVSVRASVQKRMSDFEGSFTKERRIRDKKSNFTNR